MLFSCYHHARPHQDLPNVYPSFRKSRASQGVAVGSVAASRAVLPRDAEDFEVVFEMRWSVGAVGVLERYLTANPETRTVMLQHVARDLAAKVERVTAASSKPLDKQR